ncbi:GIY-YIG nuclease family protein [Terrimonas ferruginea]|uniref:GIY-YIG nuclease family protein n=1 Tax=Terrimonas ferruginea TaxID=249 RepID=UPI000685613B
MSGFVYILKSENSALYYKGITEDYQRRLIEHNSGKSTFTANHIPWKLLYVEAHPTKRDALIRERKLKGCKKEYFEWLASQPTNILLMLPGHGLS